MKKQGTVVRWDAVKRFGFIRSPSTTADIFFHQRDLKGSLAPQAGARVTFEEIHVGGKGPRAMAVELDLPGGASHPALNRHDARPPQARHHASNNAGRAHANSRGTTRAFARAVPAPTAPILLAMLAWMGLIVWAMSAGRLPAVTPLLALLLNLATFFVYWLDKYAAQKNQWRIAEKNLHLLALLGGWPGAWVAQQVLRHKSAKAEFRLVYWVTVIVHCLGLAAWVFQATALSLLP
jgi:uncharacterized membrane protein YsdA (DUF1294 family)/cold shock CspA family protein